MSSLCQRLRRYRPSFSLRLFFVYFLLAGSLCWIMLQKALDELDLNVRQVAEETLVDTANLLAAQLSTDLSKGTIDFTALDSANREYQQRQLHAQIYQELKQQPDLNFYVTDASGRVLFNTSGHDIGADYSRWRDVALTLRGEYGARTSKTEPLAAEGLSSIIHVAAPIRTGNQIVGVVSVYKRIARFGGFLAHSAAKLTHYAIILGLLSLVFGWLMSYWLTRSTHKLVSYARQLATHTRVTAPVLHDRELQQVAAAMTDMQQQLADKDYVEHYVHTLTHELKAPLTGLRGATEILLEPDVPPAQQRKFLSNISQLTERMTALVQRLLALASLENRRTLGETQTLALKPLFSTLLDERMPQIQARQLQIDSQSVAAIEVSAEPFLLQQAIANLLDNAIDFSPEGGCIRLLAGKDQQGYWLQISDEGPGIPAFALDKIYERFFSLSRPGGRSKSTGLGLSFVREIMELHRGTVELINAAEGGVRATLRWPA